MTLAPWRPSLAHALHRNRSRPYSRYLQLATVQPDGKPRNRTLVFRGFLQDSNTLTFVTDCRSDKVDDIAYQPWAEVCWYFTETREQYRIEGRLLLVQAATPDPDLQLARRQAWESLSDTARQQFTWPPSGLPRSDPNGFAAANPHPALPLDSFGLLLLYPEAVDHLELRGAPQDRTQYRLTRPDQWIMERINP